MTNGEAVIAKLISEVADLTKANGILHAIVSNREEEISGIRAQLAQSEERVSKLQAHPGERYWEGRWRDADRALASARKALEEARDYIDIYAEPAQFSAHNLVARINVALTDENST